MFYVAKRSVPVSDWKSSRRRLANYAFRQTMSERSTTLTPSRTGNDACGMHSAPCLKISAAPRSGFTSKSALAPSEHDGKNVFFRRR